MEAKPFPTLMPYHAARDSKRSINLAEGDVIMELKQSKVAAIYSLGRFVKAEPSERDGLVKTVSVAALPKNILKRTTNDKAGQFKTRPVAVQNLVLLATAEEVDSMFWKYDEEKLKAETVKDKLEKQPGQDSPAGV